MSADPELLKSKRKSTDTSETQGLTNKAKKEPVVKKEPLEPVKPVDPLAFSFPESHKSSESVPIVKDAKFKKLSLTDKAALYRIQMYETPDHSTEKTCTDIVRMDSITGINQKFISRSMGIHPLYYQLVEPFSDIAETIRFVVLSLLRMLMGTKRQSALITSMV